MITTSLLVAGSEPTSLSLSLSLALSHSLSLSLSLSLSFSLSLLLLAANFLDSKIQHPRSSSPMFRVFPHSPLVLSLVFPSSFPRFSPVFSWCSRQVLVFPPPPPPARPLTQRASCHQLPLTVRRRQAWEISRKASGEGAGGEGSGGGGGGLGTGTVLGNPQ